MNTLPWIHHAYQASLFLEERSFAAALKNPQAAQDKLLLSLLRRNASTRFGNTFKFHSIDNRRRFQESVPVHSYDDLWPWIEQSMRGLPQVLTSDPVIMFEKTGGSTGTNKFIPYTASFLAQIAKATRPWLFDLYRQKSQLRYSTQYWSISPAIRVREKTEGGIAIGLDDDTDYFDPVSRWAIRQILSVPGQVRHINQWEEWRHVTARYLLADERLGLISVWSPTFLTVLAQYIASHAERLCRELTLSRARQLHAIVDSHAGDVIPLEKMWPHLSVISCWTEGESRAFIEPLRRFFPTTPIQGKGLMSTEGVVSVPYRCAATNESDFPTGSPLAVSSHFLEFIDLDDPAKPPKAVSELRKGARYSPLLTTAGGLYRYHLKDVVECVGHLAQTPLVSFCGKLDRVCDLAGEKLHVNQVEAALASATQATAIQPDFAMIAPTRGSAPGYCLMIEAVADEAEILRYSAQVEHFLTRSHHYAYCRSLGQLAPLACKRVSNGWLTYQTTLFNAGHALGAIKPTPLEYKYDWSTIFGGSVSHDCK